MIYSANKIGYSKNALPDNFYLLKAEKFKEITRREKFLEKKATGGLLHMFHPESTQSFVGEFFRVGFSSPDGTTTAVENLSKKYTQLREELLEEYKDNELYKQLGELNQAFETALNNVAALAFPQPFFETFIKDIQHHDFDTAFAHSMNNLNNSECVHVPNDKELVSKQYDAMPNAEAVPQFSHKINLGTEQNPKWAIIRPDKIFISTDNDPSDIRIVDLSEGTHGLDERTVQMLKYTQMLVQGMNNGTGNGNPDIIGSPIQQLNAKIFNISITFGEIYEQSGVNKTVLQSAFRDLVLSLFDEAVLAIHGETDNAQEMEQLRAESKSLGENFLSKFFSSLKSLTPQNLQDTGMSLAELAFHEAMNYIYYSVGMAVLGGGEITAGNAQNRTIISDAEFYRQMIAELLRVARENAEIYKQWAEMQAEEAERWRKIMLIAARIAAGDNVPSQDREFLMENSPGMYMIAMASRVERENPKDHESVLSDEEQSTSNTI